MKSYIPTSVVFIAVTAIGIAGKLSIENVKASPPQTTACTCTEGGVCTCAEGECACGPGCELAETQNVMLAVAESQGVKSVILTLRLPAGSVSSLFMSAANWFSISSLIEFLL